MIPRPDTATLQALVRIRTQAPAEFETLLRYLDAAERTMLLDMRDSNDPQTTRLHQGAARAVADLRTKFSTAHTVLTERSATGRESINPLPSFHQQGRSP